MIFVALVEGTRTCLSNASLGEGRRGAEGQYPLGVRAVRIFDVETERPMGIRELDLRDFSLQLLFRFHVIHAREGVMGLQQAGGYADNGHKSQSSLDHFDVISSVADRLKILSRFVRRRPGEQPMVIQ